MKGETADTRRGGKTEPKPRPGANAPARTARKQPTAMTDSTDERRGPSLDDAAQFEVSKSEGDTFRNMGQYRKAINSYTRALALQSDHKLCLLARSACYQQVGDNQNALADANRTLEDGNNFIRGLLQKADVYYQMGEFEYALIYYHRGSKIRSEIQAFRLGVQKSQEAIDNCIGDSAGIKLNKSGDLSFFMEAQKPAPSKRREDAQASAKLEPAPDLRKSRSQKSEPRDSKTVKQLLGELYADKDYLEKLLQETEKHSASKTNNDVLQLTSVGLNYLDTRMEFWQQQQPTYSRDRDRHMQKSAAITSGKSGDGREKSEPSDPAKWIVDNLIWIDTAMNDGKHKKALDRSNKVLAKAEQYTDEQVNDRLRLISNLHSYAGNAQLELGQYELALKHHKLDHDISKKGKFKEGLARAKDNLGRVYARMGEFKKAIKIFEEKLPLSETTIENAWLFHEIGRCHLELGEAEKAKKFGEKSLGSSKEADDPLWELNANILIAQSEVRMKDYDTALDSFTRSMDLASTLEDSDAQAAIKEAINDIKKRIGDRDGGEEDKPNVAEHDVEPVGDAAEHSAAGSSTSVYKISVRVSDLESAGTEENIYVELTGDLGVSRRVILEQSETNDKKFLRGQTDVFTVKSIDIGKVVKLLIGVGSTSPGSGCHIAEVVVEVTSESPPSKRYVFPCNQWFDNAQGDGRVERELNVGK